MCVYFLSVAVGLALGWVVVVVVDLQRSMFKEASQETTVD